MMQKKPQNLSRSGLIKGFHQHSFPTITQTSGTIQCILSNQINLFCVAVPYDFDFR
jgi:hypothetical protein